MLRRGVAIVVHGGAWNIPPNTRAQAGVGCELAADLGLSVLSDGGSGLDAVEAAVRHLENDPQFDAGYGSVGRSLTQSSCTRARRALTPP